MLLKNLNVFDVEAGVIRNNLDVLIENGILSDVGRIDEVDDQNLCQVECSGKFAIPGLFECHAHLVGLTAEKDEKKKQVLADFVRKGITQVRDVGGSLDRMEAMKDAVSSGKLPGPEIFYSGPMLEKGPPFWERHNEAFPGFTVAIDTKEDARRIMAELSECGASLVKTFNKFDVEVHRYLVDRAKDCGLPVTHDPGMPLFHSIPMDIGINSGVRCFEHGKSPWPLVLKDDLKLEHDRLLTSAADEETRRLFAVRVHRLSIESVSSARLGELIDIMLEKDVCICPTLHAFAAIAEHPAEEMGEGSKEVCRAMDEIGRHFTQEMGKRNVRILVGHDGANPEFTLNEMQLLKKCGLSESEIIKGATIYPAQWLGVEKKYGSILPGRKANILVLNQNPLEDIQNVRIPYLVTQNGKIVFKETNE